MFCRHRSKLVTALSATALALCALLADALRAVEECGAPMVSIPGGEPLMYPHIRELVAELVRRRKYIYLCTNALLLREKLEAGWFTPSKYLTFSVHMDGQEEHHDFAVCREGGRRFIGLRIV